MSEEKKECEIIGRAVCGTECNEEKEVKEDAADDIKTQEVDLDVNSQDNQPESFEINVLRRALKAEYRMNVLEIVLMEVLKFSRERLDENFMSDEDLAEIRRQAKAELVKQNPDITFQ